MPNLTSVIFKYQSRYFKLLDIQFGSDNSFYFIPEQHDAEVGQRVTAQKDEEGVIYLNPDDVQNGCFPTRKISRHSSGFFHIKDVIGRGGNREKDGLKGPAFNNIKSSFVFLVACPQKIDSLVEIDIPQPIDLVINLPDVIEPFTVQFAVWNKESQPDHFAPKNQMLGDGVVAMMSEEYPYGLLLGLVKVQKTNPYVVVPYPKRTFYIVR